jgi:hypothetical protein
MALCNKTRSDALKHLFPDFIRRELDSEEETWKCAILSNLPDALSGDDPEQIEFWLTVLDTYTTFETFSFTPGEVQTIASLLYSFIVRTADMRLCASACYLFVSIADPDLIPIDLLIDWRSLYMLLDEAVFSHSKIKVRKFPSKFDEMIISMIQISQRYFARTATDEMLAEWTNLLEPQRPHLLVGEFLLTTFLPVHHGQHLKWVEPFFNLWTLFRTEHSDYLFLCLFERLSGCEYPDVPWENIIPFLCNMISNYLSIPTALVQASITPVTNFHQEVWPVFFGYYDSVSSLLALFSSIMVNLLTGQTAALARRYLEQLFHLIEPFCTATLHNEDKE